MREREQGQPLRSRAHEQLIQAFVAWAAPGNRCHGNLDFPRRQVCIACLIFVV